MNDHADERIESVPWAWIRKLNQMVENAEIKFDHALPVEISPSIFLSDEKGALVKEKLNTLGITHVLSYPPNSLMSSTVIRHVWLPR